METINYTEEQLAAINADDPRICVVAGPGSGKTKVLTERIRRLFHDEHVSGSNMAALTFTRAAAWEMKERLAKANVGGVTVTTIHGFMADLLAEFGHSIPELPPRKYIVWDEQDEKDVLRAACEEMKPGRGDKPSKLFRKTWGYEKYEEKEPMVASVFRRLMGENSALTYNWIHRFAMDLAKYPEICRLVRLRFKHVFIDEYQDCSREQVEFIEAFDFENLFTIGDPNQSIFAWRGAVGNIPIGGDWRFYNLDCNFRSGRAIVEGCNRLIAKGQWRSIHPVSAIDPTTPASRLLVAGEHILPSIVEMFAPKGIAILGRTYRALERVSAMLTEEKIENHIYRRNDFWTTPTVKGILAYLQLVLEPTSNWAARRAYCWPFDDGNVDKMLDEAAQKGMPFYDYLRTLPFRHMMLKLLDELHEVSHKGLVWVKLQFDSAWPKYRSSDFYEDYERFWVFVEEREEEILDCISPDTSDMTTLQSEIAALLRWVASREPFEDDIHVENSVPLLTIHMAKGLEFNTVCIVGLEEDRFPSGRPSEDLDEERRVCYVAATRARNNLYLLHRIEKPDGEPIQPSRFIAEMLEERV